MRLVFEFSKKTIVPFTAAWVGNKVYDEMYNKSKDLVLDKDLEAQVKIKQMELRVAENERFLRQQEDLLRSQRQLSDDLSRQTQQQYNHLMDLKKKSDY